MPFGTDQMVRGTAMVPVRFTSKEGRSATIYSGRGIIIAVWALADWHPVEP